MKTHTGWLIAGAAFALLALLVIGGEAAGWPFLAQPLQRALTQTLQRDVQLNSTEAASGGTKVRFFGQVRAQVPSLQIAAPSWSHDPYFLHADDARIRLSYGALWRAHRGAPLDIDELSAEHLTVHAQRLADGRASWAFGAAPANTDRAALQVPTVHNLRVQRGELTYVDEPLKLNINAELRLAEHDGVSTAQTLSTAFKGLIASARGTYGPATLTADLKTAGAMPLLHTGADAQATPVALQLKAGKTELRFDGTVTDVLKLADMKGVFRVAGPSLAAVGDPLGVTLPTTGAFLLAGHVNKMGQVWNVVADEATVGASQLKGALTYDMRPKVPLLSGRVSGPRLLLADLAPAIGADGPAAVAAPPAAASASARVLPDREFDLPSLRMMNANVLMAFDRVELGRLFALPLEPLKTHLTLQDGKLRLNDVVARTADGNLRGEVALDGTGKVALWQADVRWSGVKLEHWLNQQRAHNAPPYITGRLVGNAQLHGQGKSTAQILGSLDGSVVSSLRDGRVSHLAIEAAGLDIAQALGVAVKGDDLLPVSCALADLRAQGGVLRPQAFVMDTTDSVVWIDGNVSLANEALDLRAVVSPKDFSPLTLRTPLHVQGTFRAPKVSLEKRPLERKLAAGVLLGLLNPLAAVIPLLDPPDAAPGADTCAQLLDRARHTQAALAPMH